MFLLGWTGTEAGEWAAPVDEDDARWMDGVRLVVVVDSLPAVGEGKGAKGPVGHLP